MKVCGHMRAYREHMTKRQTTIQSHYEAHPFGTAISGNFGSISIVRASRATKES